MAVGCTFLTKFLTALTFVIPVLLFSIQPFFSFLFYSKQLFLIYFPPPHSDLSLFCAIFISKYTELKKAIIVCIGWSAFLLFFLSVHIAFHTDESVLGVLAEHTATSAAVVLLSNSIGNLISEIFDDDKLIDDEDKGGQKER